MLIFANAAELQKFEEPFLHIASVASIMCCKAWSQDDTCSVPPSRTQHVNTRIPFNTQSY